MVRSFDDRSAHPCIYDSLSHTAPSVSSMSSGYSSGSSSHPINITVMRLFKPTFHVGDPPLCPELQSIETLSDGCAITPCLMLPETPGDTYLGQTFSAYVRATGTAERPVKNVRVTVEMHTPTTRISLKDQHPVSDPGMSSRDQSLALRLDEAVATSVEHLLTEMGVHRLQVTVTYSHLDSGEPCEIVKLYPVKVLRPINVTLNSRDQHLDNGQHRIFVECALTNMTSQPIVLHSVHFITNPEFEAVDIAMGNFAELHCDYPGQEEESNRAVLTIGHQPGESVRPLVRPNDIHQYVFSIRPKKCGARAETGASRPLKPVAGKPQELGRVLMTWRTTMGESARLQTTPVTFPNPKTKEVELAVLSVPATLSVGSPFQVQFRLRNNASRRLHLEIDWHQASNLCTVKSLCAVGTSSAVVGEVLSDQTIECEATFVAVEAGLHNLGTIIVTDTLSSEKFVFEDAAKFFVQ